MKINKDKCLNRNKGKENRKIKKISEPKSWFFQKTNKVDKPLARMSKEIRRFNLLNSGIKEGPSLLTSQIQKRLEGNTINNSMPENETAWL